MLLLFTEISDQYVPLSLGGHEVDASCIYNVEGHKKRTDCHIFIGNTKGSQED